MSQLYHTTDSLHYRYSNVDIFSMQGRMGSMRYFVLSSVIPLLIFWCLFSLTSITQLTLFSSNLLFNGIVALAIFGALVSMIYLTIQRCHDFNKSARWAFLSVIPFANIIFTLIPGTNGINRYGEIPLSGSWVIKTSFFAVIIVTISIFFHEALHYFAFQIPTSEGKRA